jgi:hypothetical protein
MLRGSLSIKKACWRPYRMEGLCDHGKVNTERQARKVKPEGIKARKVKPEGIKARKVKSEGIKARKVKPSPM